MKLSSFQAIYSLLWLGFTSILLRCWIQVRCGNDEGWVFANLRIWCVILQGLVSACIQVSDGLGLHSLDGRVLDATGPVFRPWEASGGLRGTQNCSNRLAGANEKNVSPGHPKEEGCKSTRAAWVTQVAAFNSRV